MCPRSCWLRLRPRLPPTASPTSRKTSARCWPPIATPVTAPNSPSLWAVCCSIRAPACCAAGNPASRRSSPANPKRACCSAPSSGQQGPAKCRPGKTLQPEEIEHLAHVDQDGRARSAHRSRAACRTVRRYDWEKAKQHWAFRPVQDPTAAASGSLRMEPFAHRRVHQSQARRKGPDAAAARRQARAHPPRHLRSHRSAAHARRDRRLPERYVARGVRKSGGPPARLASSTARRWGRHWLDVVRYADTSGDNSDFPVPAMFRYRNWVIAAFNSDEPYDQFLRDQIAGDILAAQDDLVDEEQGSLAAEDHRHRLPGQLAALRLAHPGVPPHHRRHHRQSGQGHSRAHRGLRALPRSQVRPHSHRRLLRALRHLQEHQLPARRHGNLPAHVRVRRARSRAGRRS